MRDAALILIRRHAAAASADATRHGASTPYAVSRVCFDAEQRCLFFAMLFVYVIYEIVLPRQLAALPLLRHMIIFDYYIKMPPMRRRRHASAMLRYAAAARCVIAYAILFYAPRRCCHAATYDY